MEALSPSFAQPTPYQTINNNPHNPINSLNRRIANSSPTPSILNNCLSRINSVCNQLGTRGVQLVQNRTKGLANYIMQQALSSPEFDMAVPGGKAAILTALTIYQQIDHADGIHRDPSIYYCANQEEIDKRKRCDGNSDCSDGTDEECNTQDDYAAGGRFACDQSGNSTETIDLSKRCDGKLDCQDKTDELPCTGEDYKKAGKFKCDTTKQVITLAQYCNGKPNCKDNSDKSNCSDKDYEQKGRRKCDVGSVVKKRQSCPEIRTTTQPLINIKKTTPALPVNYSDSITDQIPPSNTTTTILPEITNSTLIQQTLLPTNETGNNVTELWSVNSTESWSVNNTTAFPIDETSNPPDSSFAITFGSYCAVVSLCALGYFIYKTKTEVSRLQTEENRPLNRRTIGRAFINAITFGRCRQTPPPQESTHEEDTARVPLYDIEAKIEEPTSKFYTKAIAEQHKQLSESEPAPTSKNSEMRAEHGRPSKAGPIENRAGVRLTRKVFVTFEDTSF